MYVTVCLCWILSRDLERKTIIILWDLGDQLAKSHTSHVVDIFLFFLLHRIVNIYLFIFFRKPGNPGNVLRHISQAKVNNFWGNNLHPHSTNREE